MMRFTVATLTWLLVASLAHAQTAPRAPAAPRPAATPNDALESPPTARCPPSTGGERPWLDTALSAECRADALIGRLGNVDEKLEALGSGLARYGIAESMASDGPAGPTRAPGAVVLPNGLTLAASFDSEVAAEYGAVVAREFRAAGLRRMLGPTVDIARTWHAGRVPESFGEDPLLSGVIAASFVKAAQAQGVAVTLKHFAVYTQEQGRTGDLPFGLHPAVNNVVAERVAREIYLPPFRAAVEQGGALGVMCAFPRINGIYACENEWLLGILKKEWGMRGTVSPDFPDAQRSVIAAANAGLDSGSFGLPPVRAAAQPGDPPGGPNLGAALGANQVPGGVDLKTAIQNGAVNVARLDDMIRRKLVTIFAVGAEQPSLPATANFDGAAAKALALRVVEQGAVLLRNENGILPLAPSVKSIAVIGAQAGSAPQIATSGSAYVEPRATATVIDALKARAGALTITYSQGVPPLGALPLVPTEVLRAPDGSIGLHVEYHGNPSLHFVGPPLHSGTDQGIDVHTPAPVPNLPPNNGWSARWTGTLRPRASGMHTLTLAGSGSGRLFLDNVLVAHFDRVDFGAVAYAVVRLERDRPVALRAEFTPREGAPLPAIDLLGSSLGTRMQLGWKEPDSEIDRAVESARNAEVAIVFVADRHGEGADRVTLDLPGEQNRLIAAVAAANPRTVVVLSTAGPVAMPWVHDVAAILEMWYAGEVFAEGASRLLFGDAAPQGRLPITFPADERQGPATSARNYPGTVSPDGALDTAHFDEGLRVGYRWFDAKHQAPMFPFGHGLTYAPLRLTDIAVKPAGAGASVLATVVNAGKREDTEVLQIYVGFPRTSGEPPKRLAGFGKIRVPAGERRVIELPIPESAFALWDEHEHAWRQSPGPFEIMVGRSSRDIVFRSTLHDATGRE